MENKKSLDTGSTWGRALCRETGARRAGALGSVPLQWTREGGVPTGPHPFARSVVGIFCMRHVKPSPSSRGAAASAGWRGEGGGGVLRRVTTETTEAERAIGKWRGGGGVSARLGRVCATENRK